MMPLASVRGFGISLYLIKEQLYYRGKWVALLGEQVLGVGDSLKAVLCLIQDQQIEDIPLLHHVD